MDLVRAFIQIGSVLGGIALLLFTMARLEGSLPALRVRPRRARQSVVTSTLEGDVTLPSVRPAGR